MYKVEVKNNRIDNSDFTFRVGGRTLKLSSWFFDYYSYDEAVEDLWDEFYELVWGNACDDWYNSHKEDDMIACKKYADEIAKQEYELFKKYGDFECGGISYQISYDSEI